MPKTIVKHNSFGAGELSPRMYARFDVPYYEEGCKRLENMFVKGQGAAVKRAGTKYIYSVGTAPPPNPTPDPTWEECGQIGNKVDEWEFNSVSAGAKDLVHVEGTTYAMLYGGTSPPDPIFTFNCDDDGTLGDTVLDSNSGSGYNIVRINIPGSVTNNFAVFSGISYYNYYLRVSTYSIAADGTITEIDDRDFTETQVGGARVKCVVRMTGNLYAVAGTSQIVVVQIQDNGIIGDVKDSIVLYSLLLPGQVGHLGIARIGTTEYVVASRWYETFHESIGCWRIAAGTGEITLIDSFPAPLTTYTSLFETKGCTESGFNGFLLLSRRITPDNKGIQIQSISMSGGNFNQIVDTIVISADYPCSSPQVAHLGGQGYLVNFMAGIPGGYPIRNYNRNCCATFTCTSAGALEIKTDVTVVHTDPWVANLYNPIPIQLNGNSDIWMLAMSELNTLDGWIFTSDIYGGSWCVTYGNCDKYGYR